MLDMVEKEDVLQFGKKLKLWDQLDEKWKNEVIWNEKQHRKKNPKLKTKFNLSFDSNVKDVWEWGWSVRQGFAVSEEMFVEMNTMLLDRFRVSTRFLCGFGTQISKAG